jgi:hypothetical protein
MTPVRRSGNVFFPFFARNCCAAVDPRVSMQIAFDARTAPRASYRRILRAQ